MTRLDPAALSLRTVHCVERLNGPILTLRRVEGVALGDEVVVRGDGVERHGQVLEIGEDAIAVQVYEGTSSLTLDRTRIELGSGAFQLGVSADMLGRVLDGRGEPIDGGPPIMPLRMRRVDGEAMNPVARASPSDFIETGMSAIDLLASLVRGQKLPIFTGAGLPANELAARIATGVRARGGEPFATVFAALGITHREAGFFIDAFETSGMLDRVALFLNLADDPAMERLLTPRCALTLGEHLAFELGMEVLVIITDITAYGEALRELGTAREEVPGRRGYPGYLYTDLATLFERAGRIRGQAGSLTIMPIVTMPDDDITHPIPDLTGYITEGQIVLSRDLHSQGAFPPIDALPCLSRVMNAGIGEGRTRAEHRAVADQLYALYARGRELRNLVAVIGEAALSPVEARVLHFAERFERRFVHQGADRRTLDESFEIAWGLLGEIPREELIRIPSEVLDRCWVGAADGAPAPEASNEADR
jgi:V/A-type H+/Na+-transporting ATPase subunit B